MSCIPDPVELDRLRCQRGRVRFGEHGRRGPVAGAADRVAHPRPDRYDWSCCYRPVMVISATDRRYLTHAVDLAEEALAAGDEPFGSVLVSPTGEVLLEDHNHVSGGDPTRHPEFAIARWAIEYLSPDVRAHCTVYTSGEHCPMCAAAHGWAGLGRIVYAASSEQLVGWLGELGLPPGPVLPLPISAVIRHAEVDGPDPLLAERVRRLHVQRPGASLRP